MPSSPYRSLIPIPLLPILPLSFCLFFSLSASFCLFSIPFFFSFLLRFFVSLSFVELVSMSVFLSLRFSSLSFSQTPSFLLLFLSFFPAFLFVCVFLSFFSLLSFFPTLLFHPLSSFPPSSYHLTPPPPPSLPSFRPSSAG